MKTLVLNCGSSSLKFQLYNMDTEEVLIKGIVENIGAKESGLKYQKPGAEKVQEEHAVLDHDQAIKLVQETLCHPEHGCLESIHEIETIGHRVVHGAETFTGSVLITEAVLKKLKECARFAPLHNPPNIKGIQASLWQFPFARQVAVFDTAFHQTMEPHAYLYGLPYEWYKKKGIRRYGFHGTSHNYVAREAARILEKPFESLKIVICHIGSGASMAAVREGKSIDTSMGFTPLEGMIMATRCGDIDPAIPLYMIEEEGLTTHQMDEILNKKSGMAGLTGGEINMMVVERKALKGDRQHLLALAVQTYRVKKYIGAYAAAMGGLDCVVFTAGVGENSPIFREMACSDLEFLGIELDPNANEKNAIQISVGPTPVLVIPTNEELAIARESLMVLEEEVKLRKK